MSRRGDTTPTSPFRAIYDSSDPTRPQCMRLRISQQASYWAGILMRVSTSYEERLIYGTHTKRILQVTAPESKLASDSSVYADTATKRALTLSSRKSVCDLCHRCSKVGIEFTVGICRCSVLTSTFICCIFFLSFKRRPS